MGDTVVRGIAFVDVEKPRKCVVCGEVCSRKTSMMKQFCKCGCGADAYSCMGCSTIKACDKFPSCKREKKKKKKKNSPKIFKKQYQKNNLY